MGSNVTDGVWPAGTRIRLVLTPLDTPDWERNDNTGGLRVGYVFELPTRRIDDKL